MEACRSEKGRRFNEWSGAGRRRAGALMNGAVLVGDGPVHLVKGSVQTRDGPVLLSNEAEMPAEVDLQQQRGEDRGVSKRSRACSEMEVLLINGAVCSTG